MDKDKGSCSATPAAGSCSATPAAGACATTAGKGKCCGKMVLSAVAGGIVMFIWVSLAWMVLPLHKGDINGFKDEKAVAAAIGKNIQGDGIYVIPDTKMGTAKPKTAKPYAYVVVKGAGVDVANAMKPALAKELLLCLFLAGMLGCLLKKTAGTGCPLALSFKVGLLAGAAGYLPNYIWFNFPLNGALIGVFETVVGFVLAGLVISKLVLDIPLGGKCATKTDCAKPACGTKPEEKK